MQSRRSRNGFTLLELQVAFLIFTLAMAGLCPLVVMQSKHLRRIESQFSHNKVYYLVPSTDPWAQKLGASASISTIEPNSVTSPVVLLSDDGDASFSQAGDDWNAVESTESLQGDCYQHDAGDGSGIATWQFNGLKPGWYDVRVTWLEGDGQATNAPFTVYDDVDEEKTTLVNQQVAPIGEEYEGRPWDSLGTFFITSGEVNVKLSDDADEKIVADGVRLVPVTNDIQIDSVEKSLTGEDTVVHVTVNVEVPQ